MRQQAALDHVAGIFEIHGKGPNLRDTLLTGRGKCFRVEVAEIGANRDVHAVEYIVHAFDVADAFTVVTAERLAGRVQHRFKEGGQPQRLARCPAKCNDRRLTCCRVEIDRARRVSGSARAGSRRRSMAAHNSLRG